VTDVMAVSTAKLSDPVADVVLMEPFDLALHA
jgi:hypothetical protein